MLPPLSRFNTSNLLLLRLAPCLDDPAVVAALASTAFGLAFLLAAAVLGLIRSGESTRTP